MASAPPHARRPLLLAAALAAAGGLLCASPASAKAKERVLYSFSGGVDGGGPSSSPAFDAQGNLYATTHFGGILSCGGIVGGGCGVVFRLTPSSSGSWTETPLYAFADGPDGGFPNAGVILDPSGNVYGTASTGGSTACSIGCGVVYELTDAPSGWSERVLHTFGGADGQFPNATLFAGNGSLYSTTWYGGAHGAGTVFSLTPSGSTWTEQVLYSFTGAADGSSPAAGVIQDANGTLYGTTYPFNGNNDGVAYALSPAGHGAWKDRVINTFSGASGGAGGENPYAGLIMDTAGNLFGTTIEGGPSGVGVAFELVRQTAHRYREKVLHGFTGSPDGSEPYAGLTMDSVGNLFGATLFGGASNAGTIFELQRSPNGHYRERVLYSFTGGNDGKYPQAAPTFHDAALFGTTESGGTSGSGVVYEVTP